MDCTGIPEINGVKLRQFKEFSFDVLAVGEKLMVTKMNYKESDQVPPYLHPNEQRVYVISGQYSL